MVIFYFFLSNTTYFTIVDYIYDFKSSHADFKSSNENDEKNNFVKQWFIRFRYNLCQNIIHILFNNEKQIVISNSRESPES